VGITTLGAWRDYANLLALDRGTTNPVMTAAEKNGLINEVYDWLHAAMTPRVEYLSQAGFTHADGVTVTADSGLRLVNASNYLMTTNLTNIAELFSVHFEGLAGADPNTIESTQLEYLEHTEFLERRATLGNATAPRYVHWRRLAVTGATSQSSVGKWELVVAPAKSQASGAGTWWFSAVVRRELVSPTTDISSAPALSGDSAVPDLLPHEVYLGARLVAFEIAARNGRDPAFCNRIVRNVPKYLLKSWQAARGIGEATGIAQQGAA
jgi:hypothetical protein